jgi:23S rRNA pseudouridine955/2504/2580 synthase/23S rRNA pseudouridine1911/1915/1917 synthase
MLTAGEKLAYDVSGIPEPPVDPSFEVIHADPELLVINKSGNLPCHPAGRYFNHTLWAQLKSAGVCETPYFVNRLDRETSGLVVVARTAEAARACRTQFATRQVEKRYLALVEGIFPVEPWQANGWLLPDEGDGVRKKRRFVLATDGFDAPANGEWSETGLKLIRQLDEIALVEVTPVTGRLHQIRATLWSIGFPLVGDKLYGLDVSWFDRFRKNDLSAHDWQRLRMKRQALHAAGLRFCHPHDGRELKFEVPLPADMRALACY